VTLDNVFVSSITSRETDSIGNSVDKEACFAICSYNEPDTGCSGVSVMNSIASGCVFAGFVAPGHACGAASSQTNFKDNVSHSNNGMGARIYADPSDSSQSDCYEGSHFHAYHN
jgi:hypothetical protein